MSNDEGRRNDQSRGRSAPPFFVSSFGIRASSFVEVYFDSISSISTQRLLYPHSLSYQPTTFTNRFPSMMVSLLSKMHECGLPIMSCDTSGSSLYSRTPL